MQNSIRELFKPIWRKTWKTFSLWFLRRCYPVHSTLNHTLFDQVCMQIETNCRLCEISPYHLDNWSWNNRHSPLAWAKRRALVHNKGQLQALLNAWTIVVVVFVILFRPTRLHLLWFSRENHLMKDFTSGLARLCCVLLRLLFFFHMQSHRFCA